MNTVNFIVLFDYLSDILNSRNPLAKGFKAPLNPAKFTIVDTCLNNAEQCIMSLIDQTGTSILRTRRKQAFWDFLSVSKKYKYQTKIFSCLPTTAPTRCLLTDTYMLSQDHPELFFGAVRSAARVL